MGQTVTLQRPFAGGLDQKQSPHYLDPEARLATVINGNFVKANAVDKRIGIGFVGASSQDDLPANSRLVSWSKADLLALCPGGPGLGAVNIDPQAQTIATPIGALPPASVVRRPVPAVAESIDVLPVCCDFPSGSAMLRIVLYAGPATAAGVHTIWVTVYDVATGGLILPPEQLSSAGGTGGVTTGQLLPINALFLPNAPAGQRVALFWADTGFNANTNQICAVSYNPATNNFGGVTVIATPYVGTTSPGAPPPLVDVAPFVNDSTGRYILAFASSSTNYTFQLMTPAHAVSGSTIAVTAPGGYVAGGGFTFAGSVPAPNQLYACGTFGAGEHFWFTYTFSNTTTVRVFVASFDQTFPGGFTQWEITGLGTGFPPAGVSAIFLTGPVRFAATEAWLGWYVPLLTTGSVLTKSYQGVGVLLGTAAGLIATASAYLPYGFLPIARPFVFGHPPNGLTTVYLPCALYLDQTSLQGTFYLLQQVPQLLSGGSIAVTSLPCANSAPRQVDLASIANGIPVATGPSTTIGGLGHLAFPSNAILQQDFTEIASTTAVLFRMNGGDSQTVASTFGVSSTAGLNLSTWAATLNFEDPLQYETAELGGELHISGGLPFINDGAAVVEDNFFFYPEFAFASSSGAGTALPSGNYSYAVVYVYPDAAGNVHRSAPFFTNSIAIVNGGAFPTVSFPVLPSWRDVGSAPLSLANPGQVFAEIYRTIASPATPVYYLLDRVPASGQPAASFVTYSDNATGNGNAQLQISTVLYTAGGVIDQVCPPALNALTVHKGRIWAVDDTLRTIWFTNQFVMGQVPGWNEALTIPFSDGGDIVALRAMDSELIVFKGSSIWVIYGGDGPNQLATGNDIQTPQRVSSDVGCVDWRSIVATPVGLMFASSSGIYLLDRSLAVTYTGKNVADIFAQFPTCVGATLVPGVTQVRFAMQSASITSTVLVYDYLLQQWAQHSYLQQPFPVTSITKSQRGVYSMITSDNNVWQEKTSGKLYEDQDTSAIDHFVPTTITTAEIKVQGPGALQGYQRCRWVQLFADRLDPCAITMSLAFNGDPTIKQTRSWTQAQLRDLPYSQISQHVGAAFTKCQSVQVTLTDVADAVTAPTTGQGVRWSGLAIELDALKDRYRQVPGQNR